MLNAAHAAATNLTTLYASWGRLGSTETKTSSRLALAPPPAQQDNTMPEAFDRLTRALKHGCAHQRATPQRGSDCAPSRRVLVVRELARLALRAHTEDVEPSPEMWLASTHAAHHRHAGAATVKHAGDWTANGPNLQGGHGCKIACGPGFASGRHVKKCGPKRFKTGPRVLTLQGCQQTNALQNKPDHNIWTQCGRIKTT